MELPSARELELEVLLRERESQLANLKDEVLSLRQYLSTQPGPSTTEAVTLPPAILSVLLPHIEAADNNTVSSVSATVAGGLNQRIRQLQEENDELYNLLKTTETGKLKDEVRSLRKAVAKLEGALKESHQVIYSLSEELEKTHETLMNSSRQKDPVHPNPKAYSNSPRAPYRPEQTSSNSSKTNASKPPPTGPRAYKRPRLSEPQASPPPPRPVAPLPPKPQTQNNLHSHSHLHTQNRPPMGPVRDHSRHSGSSGADNTKRHKANQSEPNTNHIPKMDMDGMDPPSSKAPPPETVRERDRVREREKNNKERERRDRDVNPISTNSSKPQPNNPTARRNGNNHSNTGRGGGGGGTGTAGGTTGRRTVNAVGGSSSQSDNRTLQERMGL